MTTNARFKILWGCLGGVETIDLSESIVIPTLEPGDLWAMLTDYEVLSEITKSECEMKPESGGRISLFGGITKVYTER